MFQLVKCISSAFFRQTLLQGCFIECENLRSPMISYRSLIFIATIMNDEPLLLNIIYILHLALELCKVIRNVEADEAMVASLLIDEFTQ